MGNVDAAEATGELWTVNTVREYGNVSIPQEAFIAALRMGEE